jgi:hypothetical protein
MNRSAHSRSHGFTLVSVLAAIMLLLFMLVAPRLQIMRWSVYGPIGPDIVLFYLVLAALALSYLWIVIVTWLRSRGKAGALLLDLGRSRKQVAWGSTLGALGGLSAMWWLVFVQNPNLWYRRMLILASTTGAELSANLVFTGLIALVWVSFYISILSLFLALSRMEIREHGLLYFFDALRWEGIASYEWGGKSGYTLIVRRRGRWGWKIRLPIPPEHKEATEDVLARCLGADRGGLEGCASVEGARLIRRVAVGASVLKSLLLVVLFPWIAIVVLEHQVVRPQIGKAIYEEFDQTWYRLDATILNESRTLDTVQDSAIARVRELSQELGIDVEEPLMHLQDPEGEIWRRIANGEFITAMILPLYKTSVTQSWIAVALHVVVVALGYWVDRAVKRPRFTEAQLESMQRRTWRWVRRYVPLLMILLAAFPLGGRIWGLRAMSIYHVSAQNLDAVVTDLLHLSIEAHQYHRTALNLGGGGQSFAGLTADATGLSRLTPYGENENGVYSIVRAGTAKQVVIQGVGKRDADRDGIPVTVKLWVRADVEDDSLAVIHR